MPGGGVGAGTIWASLALRLEGLFQNVQQAQKVMEDLDKNMQAAADRASKAASEATAAHARGAAQALSVEQANWKARIALAGQGTAEQKRILTEYLQWLQTQLARTDLTPGMTASLQNQVASVIRQMDTMARQATAAAESARAAQERAAAQAAAAAERAAKAQAAAQARAAKQAEAAAARAAAVQQQMAEQTLRVEMSQWKMRVAATAQGTAEQKAILAQYYAWLQTQSTMPGMRPGTLASVNKEIANVTKQINNMGKTTQAVGSQMEATFGRMQRTLAAFIGVEIFRRATSALSELPQLAFQTAAGFRIVERQAEATGQSLDRVHTSMERLATDLHTVKEALAQPVAELMRYGYTIEQIEGIFRGAAASGLLVGKTIDQSIKLVSEALISQRSILLNEIGIVENLDTAMTQYARSLGKTADELTASERAMASYQMIVRATANEVRDLPILMEGYGGATAEAGQATYRLKQAMGEALLPVMTQLKHAFAGLIEAITPFAATLASLTEAAIPALTAIIMYRLVVALQAMIVKMIEAGNAATALKIALNPVAGIVSAIAAALVYFGLQAAAHKRSLDAIGGAVGELANKYSQEAAQAQKSIRTSIEKARAMQDEKRLLDQYLPTLDSFRGKENLTAEESDNLKSALNALAERFPWLDAAVSTTSENFDNALRALHNYRTGINQTMADILTSMNMVAGLKLPELEQQLAEQERMLQEARRQAMELTQYQAVRDPFAMTDILRRWGVELKDGQTIFDQFAEELQRRSGEAASNIQTLTDSVAHTRVAIEQLQQAQKDYATFRATGWLPDLPKPVIEESTPTGKEKTALQLWREEAAVFKQTIALAEAGYGDLSAALTKYRDFLRATADDAAREHEVRAAAASELKGILSDLVQVELDAFEQLKANGDAAVDTYEEQIAYLQGIIDKSAELQMLEEDRAKIEAEIWDIRNAQYEAEARKLAWNTQQQLDNYKTMVQAHALSVDQRLEAEAKVFDLTARVNDAAYRSAVESYELATHGLDQTAIRRKEIYQREVVDKLKLVKLSAEAEQAIQTQLLQFDREIAAEKIKMEAQSLDEMHKLEVSALRATGQARQAELQEARRQYLDTMADLQKRFQEGLLDVSQFTTMSRDARLAYMGKSAEIGLDALKEAFEERSKTLAPHLWIYLWDQLRRAFEEQYLEQFPLDDTTERAVSSLIDAGFDVSRLPEHVAKQLKIMGDEIKAAADKEQREIASYIAGVSAAALEAAGKALDAALVQENERYEAAKAELESRRPLLTDREYRQALTNIESEHEALIRAINAMYTADITLAGAMAKALGDNQELAAAEAQVEHLKTSLQDLVKRGVGGKELDDAVAALAEANDRLNELSLTDALQKIVRDAEQQRKALEAHKLLGMTEAEYLQAQANIITQQINATVTQLLAAGRTQEEATVYVKELIDEANRLMAEAEAPAKAQAALDASVQNEIARLRLLGDARKAEEREAEQARDAALRNAQNNAALQAEIHEAYRLRMQEIDKKYAEQTKEINDRLAVDILKLQEDTLENRLQILASEKEAEQRIVEAANGDIEKLNEKYAMREAEIRKQWAEESAKKQIDAAKNVQDALDLAFGTNAFRRLEAYRFLAESLDQTTDAYKEFSQTILALENETLQIEIEAARKRASMAVETAQIKAETADDLDAQQKAALEGLEEWWKSERSALEQQFKGAQGLSAALVQLHALYIAKKEQIDADYNARRQDAEYKAFQENYQKMLREAQAKQPTVDLSAATRLSLFEEALKGLPEAMRSKEAQAAIEAALTELQTAVSREAKQLEWDIEDSGFARAIAELRAQGKLFDAERMEAEAELAAARRTLSGLQLQDAVAIYEAKLTEINRRELEHQRKIAALLAGVQASALEAAGQAMEAAIVRENERYAAVLYELQQTGLPTDSFEYKEALANIESEHRALLQAINVMYSADITLAGAMAKALGDNQELAEAEAQVEQLKTALQDLVKRGIGGKELDDAVAALSAANDKLNELSLADALKKIESDAEQQKQALEAQKLLGMTEAQYLQEQANIITQQINATVTQLLAAGRTQEEATAYVKELIDEANKLIADAKTATKEADIAKLMEQYDFDMGVTTPGKGAVSLARQIGEWIGPSADLAEAEKKLELTEQLIQQLIALGEPLDSARMQELFGWWGAYWLEVKNLTETVDATVKAQEAIKRAKELISETSDKQRQALVAAGLLTETEAMKAKLDALKEALESYVLYAEKAGIASEEAAETVTLLREQIQGLSADIEEDEALDKWIEKLQELKQAYEDATGALLWLEEEMAEATNEEFNRTSYMKQYLIQHIRATASAWLAEGKSIEQVRAAIAPLLTDLRAVAEEEERLKRQGGIAEYWSDWRQELAKTIGGPFYDVFKAGWDAWKLTDADADIKLAALKNSLQRAYGESLGWLGERLSLIFERITGTRAYGVTLDIAGKIYKGAIDAYELATGALIDGLHTFVTRLRDQGMVRGTISIAQDIVDWLGAELRRLGEDFLWSFPEVREVLNAITSLWKIVSAGIVKMLGAADSYFRYLEEHGRITLLEDLLRGIGGFAKRFFVPLRRMITRAIDALGRIDTNLFGGSFGEMGRTVANMIGNIAIRAGAVIERLMVLALEDPILRDALKRIVDAFQFVAKHLGSAIEQTVDFIENILPDDLLHKIDIPAIWVMVSDALGKIAEYLIDVPEGLKWAIGGIGAAVNWVVDTIDEITRPLQEGIWQIVEWMSSGLVFLQDVFANLYESMSSLLRTAISRISEVLITLMAPLAPVFTELLKAAEPLKPVFDAIGKMFQLLANVVGMVLLPVFRTLWPVIKGFGWVLAEVALIIGAAWNALVWLVDQIPLVDMSNYYMDTGAIAEARNKMAGLEFPVPDTVELEEKIEALRNSLQNAFKSAFSASSLAEATVNFGKSLQQTVKDAIINAFMESAAMKPLFDRLSKAIADAMKDGVMSASEWSNIQGLSEPIKQQMQNLWETLKNLGLISRGSGSSGSSERGLQVTRLTGESRQLFVELLRPITQLPEVFSRLLARIDEGVEMLKQMTQGIGLEIQEATITILRASVTIQSADVVYVNGPVYGGGGMTSLRGAIRSGA